MASKSREVKADIIVDATKAEAGAKKAEKALGDVEKATGKTKEAASLGSIAQDELNKKLGRMADVVPGGQKAIDGLTESLGASGVAATITAGAAVAFGAKAYGAFSDAAQGVLKFQRVAGTTAEDSGRWIEVFDDYGVSADDAAGLVGKFSKVIGSTPQVLDQLDIAIARLRLGYTPERLKTEGVKILAADGSQVAMEKGEHLLTMPPRRFKSLTDAQIDAVIKYLESQKK